MAAESREAVVARLAGDFPLFAASTIDRWLGREIARHDGAPDALAVAGGVVRATLDELSREHVATSRQLPLAPSTAADGRQPSPEPA